MNSYHLEEEEESKNRQKALIITIVINAIMFYLFWYITVWTSEENKKEEIAGGGGFVMNFGTDKSGSGRVYTRNKASDLKEEIESKAAPEEKKIEKVAPPVVSPPLEKVKVAKSKPVKEAPLVSSKLTSPVKVKEEVVSKVAKKVEPKPTESKTVATAKPVEKAKIDNSALLPTKRGNATSNGTNGSESRPGGASDGTSKGKGNQGQPEGKIVEGGEYTKRPAGDGNGGTGGNAGSGSSLSMTGWTWYSKPVVDDDSNDTGIIRFKIKVDSDGDVVDISLIESSVSPTVMQKYKNTVKRTKFKPTSDGDRPEYSSGTVIFKLSPR